jgi:aminodeoxyfutalosine synthase
MALPEDLTARALAGVRLGGDDLRTLLATPDILAVGALADDLRRGRHGARTTFVRVHAVDVSAETTWSAEIPRAAGEIRVTGHPGGIEVAAACVRRVASRAEGRPVRGFTAGALAALDPGLDAFATLVAAGLTEIALVEAETSPVVVHAARAAGLAVRVLGVHRAVAEPASWLLQARALQDAVGGLEAIAPLPRESDAAAPTTGFQDVRLVAVTRLAFESVPRIQVDWRRYGPKLAQVALTVGADDLDAVSPVDDEALGPRRSAVEDVRRNITAAGLVPVARDGAFRVRD